MHRWSKSGSKRCAAVVVEEIRTCLDGVWLDHAARRLAELSGVPRYGAVAAVLLEAEQKA